MTEDDEKLAPLLDDEPAEASALDAVIDDVNLQYRLRRYRLIGEAMRRELPAAIDTGFHATVMARIRDDRIRDDRIRDDRIRDDRIRDDRIRDDLIGDGAAPTRRPRAASAGAGAGLGRWRPLAGFAVAASVAVVTVALWQPLSQPAATPGESVAASEQARIEGLASQRPQTGAVPASTQIQSLGLRWKVDGDAPDLQQKLNAYLVNHTEYSNSVQGLIPQARVAGFDARQ